jgi:hypothetical protein
MFQLAEGLAAVPHHPKDCRAPDAAFTTLICPSFSWKAMQAELTSQKAADRRTLAGALRMEAYRVPTSIETKRSSHLRAGAMVAAYAASTRSSKAP